LQKLSALELAVELLQIQVRQFMSTPSPFSDSASLPHRRGVVAVVVREQRLLVIRRAKGIAAPGAYCFPGGGIEVGETEQIALRREIDEELGVEVQPLRRLWNSVTPWEVTLAWWEARLSDEAALVPNPDEVAEVHWLTIEEMRALPELLESNHHFLDAMGAGQFSVEGLDS
jgi:8-oxo-dGTP diphosphatase